MARHSTTTQESQLKNHIWAFVALALMLVLATPSRSVAQPPEKQWVKGQVLVHPNPGLSEDEFSQILNRHKGKKLRKIPSLNVHVIEVPEQAEEAVANALSHNPHVKFAEVNEIIEPSALIPNDPSFPSQWHLSKIQGPEAWSNALGSGVTVAVLDSGIDAAHQDFAGQLLTGWNVISGNSSNVADITGHGTAVAGVVMAKGNNGVGVASVAWSGKILPIRITNSSSGTSTLEYMAAGITYAADHGAKVANLSYQVGAGNYSTIISAAQYMRNRGGVVVVAAGNTGGLREGNDNAYLISVSATTSSDAFWSSSSYGNFVDVAAPGSSITTTNRGGGYGAWSGTSFSSPMTAGVMALILSANPSLSPQAAENILEGSADDLGNQGWDNKFGHGRINAARAVEMAMVGTSNDTQDPTVQFGSPSAGSTVSDIVSVVVSASDNVGVTRVELYAGGVLVGQDTTAPYQFSWDTRNGNNGNVALQALAYDAANNVGTTTRTVTVNNVGSQPDSTPPTITSMSPSDGSSVSRSVTIQVSASDNVQVTSVKLYIDGVLKSSVTSGSLSYGWNTRKVSSGSHLIKAIAQDAAGNSTTKQISLVVGGSTGKPGGGKGKK
ncbi:MAG: S8 family serine peptidase [Nitrospirota bacterium]|nr:S8 family serine peptidase [Nitrospirota bacterium]